MRSLLPRLDLRVLAPLAMVLALAPFSPQPHLVEKLGMAWRGTLTRPIDVFDMILHGSGIAIVIAVLIARVWARGRARS